MIDFGSADQHKYTRGGWETGWAAWLREDDGVTYAETDETDARLSMRLVHRPAELVLRARSAGAPQDVTIRAGEDTVGIAHVGTDWTVARLPANELPVGSHLVLDLSRDDDADPLEVDWLGLFTEKKRSPPASLVRMAPITVGGKARRALLAPASRSYSFYLHPPDGSRLIFDVGSAGNVEFVVRAETVDGNVRELYRGRATPGHWREVEVSLANLAGRAIRLELATDGTAPDTGWGEPAIYVPEHHQRNDRLATGRGRKTAKNLILVVMDTTRADAFGPFAPHEHVSTPSYDSFAARATTFQNAYVNANWTKPSVASLLSALYPATHTARYATSILPEEVKTLPQHLQGHGFTTAALIANAVVSDPFGFNRGWDTFENLSSSDAANGAELFPRAARWLRRHASEGRFFLYVQSIDAHVPYDVPASYSSHYFDGSYDGWIGPTFERPEQVAVDNYSHSASKEDLAWIRALYFGEVSYQDHHLGALLSAVKKLGLEDDTIVVVTNDHGEELRDHDHMGHGWTLYDEMIRSPLAILYPPLFPPASRIDEVVEEVDLAPTLVEALGLPPMPDAEGISYLPLLAGRPPLRRPPFYAVAYSRNGMRSVRVGRWKLIAGAEHGWLRLFDDQADPAEKRDRRDDASLAGRLCEVYLGEALASPAKLGRLRSGVHQRDVQSSNAELDAKTRRQLEALGYL